MIYEFFTQTSSRHLFWKEYRAQRTLWVSVLILAGMYGLLLLAWGALMSASGGISPGVVFFTMFAFPPVYAWACAALLFAGEHEEETYEFLRAQPTIGGQVYSVKLLTILAGTLLMVPAILLLGLLLTGGQFDVTPFFGQIELDGFHWVNVWVTSLEMLAWSILFSLWLRKMLPALLLSAGFALLMAILAVSLMDLNRSALHFVGADSLVFTGQFVRILVALLVLGLTAKWGRNWLGAGLPQSQGKSRDLRAATMEARFRFFPPSLYLNRLGCPQLAHLTWHAWKQSASIYLATLAIVTLACLLLAVRWSASRTSGPGNSLISLIPFWYALVPLAGWCGLLCFLPDQASRRSSYFAERPVHPGQLWLSRLLLAALFPLCWLVLVSVLTVGNLFWAYSPLSGFQTGSQVAIPYFEALASSVDVGAILWLMLLLFAVGQLVSLFSRSVVVGITVGIASLVVVGAVFGLTYAALRVPGGLVVIPLFITFLIATRCSMTAWTQEVQRRGELLRKATWIGVPVLLVTLMTCTYRVLEIPRVTEPTLSPSSPLHVDQLRRPPTNEEVITARMYLRIFQHFRGYPQAGTTGRPGAFESMGDMGGMGGMGDMGEWSLPEPLGPPEVRTDREVLREFVEATRRPAWFPPRHGTRGTSGLTNDELVQLREVPPVVLPLVSTVATRMYQSLENGDLEQAMDYPLALIRFSRQLMRQADLTGNFTARTLELRGMNLLTHWASWEGQSHELVRRALREVDGSSGRSTRWDSNGSGETNETINRMELAERDSRWDHELFIVALRRERLWTSDVVSDRPAHVEAGAATVDYMLKYLRWMRRYAPWEISRIERILDVALATEDERDLPPDFRRWFATTPFLREFGSPHGDVWQLTFRERHDRLVIHHLQLALRAYHLEHGRYPDQLADLPEDDRQGIPESVVNGGPETDSFLVYLPQGIDHPLSFNMGVSARNEWTLPAGHPLLRRNESRIGMSGELHGAATVVGGERAVTYFPVP